MKALHKKLTMINFSSEKAISLIQSTNDKIDELQRESDKDRLVVTQGVMLRSKARSTAEGEHSSKYFFCFEKSNARSKSMNATMTSHTSLKKFYKSKLTFIRNYILQIPM